MAGRPAHPGVGALVLGVLASVVFAIATWRLVGVLLLADESGRIGGLAEGEDWLAWMMVGLPAWFLAVCLTGWGRQASAGRVVGAKVAWGFAITGVLAVGLFGFLVFAGLLGGSNSGQSVLVVAAALALLPLGAWGWLLAGPREPGGPELLY